MEVFTIDGRVRDGNAESEDPIYAPVRTERAAGYTGLARSGEWFFDGAARSRFEASEDARVMEDGTSVKRAPTIRGIGGAGVDRRRQRSEWQTLRYR